MPFVVVEPLVCAPGDEDPFCDDEPFAVDGRVRCSWLCPCSLSRMLGWSDVLVTPASARDRFAWCFDAPPLLVEEEWTGGSGSRSDEERRRRLRGRSEGSLGLMSMSEVRGCGCGCDCGCWLDGAVDSDAVVVVVEMGRWSDPGEVVVVVGPAVVIGEVVVESL